MSSFHSSNFRSRVPIRSTILRPVPAAFPLGRVCMYWTTDRELSLMDLSSFRSSSFSRCRSLSCSSSAAKLARRASSSVMRFSSSSPFARASSSMSSRGISRPSSSTAGGASAVALTFSMAEEYRTFGSSSWSRTRASGNRRTSWSTSTVELLNAKERASMLVAGSLANSSRYGSEDEPSSSSSGPL